MHEIYTLYTRSNFDGLVCAALLKQIGFIDEIKFVHPKDVQDAKIPVDKNTVTASLPYAEGVYIAFDHHSSEMKRIPEIKENFVFEPGAPSSARVIYEYFGGEDKFGPDWEDILDAVDVADCSDYTERDIHTPENWVLLNYIMDPRTNLGRHKIFEISNLNLMYKLVDLIPSKPIEEILEDPDIKERIKAYFNELQEFKTQVRRCTTVNDNIAVLDLRDEIVIHIGNRFMIYSLFPECNISIVMLPGLNNQNTVFAVGKSIIKKPCITDLGVLLYERYNGGGHANAATLQVSNDRADEVLNELINLLKGEV